MPVVRQPSRHLHQKERFDVDKQRTPTQRHGSAARTSRKHERTHSVQSATWETVRLGDFVTLKRGYDLSSSQRVPGPVPIVSSSGITGYHNVARVMGPGVVTGRYGTLGKVFFVKKDFWPLNTSLYVENFKGNNPRFTAYFLKHVLATTTGDNKAAVPGHNRNDLHGLSVRVIRDIEVQDSIASVLAAYDDLIENNRKRIRLLEQAARMLYEEWFVHLRFPGHEHVCITNSVPDGWKTTRLGKVISELQSGKRPRGGSSVQGVPSIGAENVLGLGQYEYGKEKFIPADYFASMNKGIVKNRDVVIYKDGANIGRSSYFGDGFPHEKCAVNEHVFRCRALSEIGQNFLYFWASQDDTRQRIANLNSNTAQPGVSRAKIETLSFTKPAPDVLRRFNDIVEPFIGQAFLLARTCQRLSETRDRLLSHVIPTKIA